MGARARGSRPRRWPRTIRRPQLPRRASALEIDPHLADAELLLAELDLDNTRWDAARERIARVLADNPSHLEARALAAAHHLRSRQATGAI